MAYIVSSNKDMVGMIGQAVETLQYGQAEMVILPMIFADTKEKALALLPDVKSFDPRRDSDVLHKDAVGIVRVNTERTVHDALDALNDLSMVSVADTIAAASCAVKTHVKGKTRKINLKMFGEIIVDLAKFAEQTGLPVESANKLEYAAFVLDVPNLRDGGTRTVLVLVKGLTDSENGNGGKANALVSMLARLESRSKSGFDTGASFHAKDLENGWQLFNNKHFVDVLGWVRRGYYYSVGSDENQGINISY